MQAEARYLTGISKAQSYELNAVGQLIVFLGRQSDATEAMIFSRK